MLYKSSPIHEIECASSCLPATSHYIMLQLSLQHKFNFTKTASNKCMCMLKDTNFTRRCKCILSVLDNSIYVTHAKQRILLSILCYFVALIVLHPPVYITYILYMPSHQMYFLIWPPYAFWCILLSKLKTSITSSMHYYISLICPSTPHIKLHHDIKLYLAILFIDISFTT